MFLPQPSPRPLSVKLFLSSCSSRLSVSPQLLFFFFFFDSFGDSPPQLGLFLNRRVHRGPGRKQLGSVSVESHSPLPAQSFLAYFHFLGVMTMHSWLKQLWFQSYILPYTLRVRQNPEFQRRTKSPDNKFRFSWNCRSADMATRCWTNNKIKFESHHLVYFCHEIQLLKYPSQVYTSVLYCRSSSHSSFLLLLFLLPLLWGLKWNCTLCTCTM